MNNHIQLVLKSSTTEMSLNDHESGIYLVPELEGLTGLPEIRTTSGVNAGYDGGWTSAQNFDARSITIRGVIANTDVATVERMRKQLIALLAQGKNEPLTLNLVTEAGNSYELEVRTIACEMALQTVLQQQEFLIQLRADDPLIYDSSAGGESVLVQVQHAIGGFEISFELPLAISGGEGESVIENAGLEKVYPVINMYGALHNPTFVNVTTNQQIQVNATLGYAEGEWSTPSDVYEGKAITIDDAPDNAPLASFQLDGETSQNGTPTPDAPVPVQTVTGENVVKITGKNLFDKTAATLNYRIGSDGLPYGDNQFFLSDYIGVKPSTNYIVSNGTTSDASAVAYYDASGAFISRTISGTWYNIRTPNNAAYIRFTTKKSTIDSVQLELGSTATAYEPYQGQSYTIDFAPNLYKYSDRKPGYYLDSSGAEVSASIWTISNYIPVVAGETYTYSGITNAGSAPYSAYYDSNKTYISSFKQATGSNYLKIPSGAAYVRFSLDGSESDTAGGAYNFKFLEYSNKFELCKIGDYQDYIYKSDGKWYKHKAINKIIEDGSQTWYRAGTATSGKYMLDTDINDMIVMQSTSVAPPVFCTRFAPKSFDDLKNNIIGISGRQVGRSGVYIYDDVHFVANDFKNWLVSNPMTIYYPLATPTDTEITNEALIAQLEAVLGGHTYAGTNNIFTITPNEQGTLEISYMTEKGQDRRDAIVIDSRMRTITLNGTDAYHLLAEGSEFPILAPGENKLLLRSDTPGDNGYAEVNYKQGYLSI